MSAVAGNGGKEDDARLARSPNPPVPTFKYPPDWKKTLPYFWGLLLELVVFCCVPSRSPTQPAGCVHRPAAVHACESDPARAIKSAFASRGIGEALLEAAHFRHPLEHSALRWAGWK